MTQEKTAIELENSTVNKTPRTQVQSENYNESTVNQISGDSRPRKKEGPVNNSAEDKAKGTSPASATAGGREISKTVLYVGGIHKSVTEAELKEFLGCAGEIKSEKLLKDKNKPGFNYAFVEFSDTDTAERVFSLFDGKNLHDSALKINWAYQSSSVNSENDEEPLFGIFVGDLSAEVDDEALAEVFLLYSSLKQARVMWDMQTSRSRGYGFVNFSDKTEAENALKLMNGKTIWGRPIRCNWASYRQVNNNNGASKGGGGRRNNQSRSNKYFNSQAFPTGIIPLTPSQSGQAFMSPAIPLAPGMPNGPLQHVASTSNVPQKNVSFFSPYSYDMVLRQTPSWQTTVYLGNLFRPTYYDLLPLLQNFGFIVDLKVHPERRCAFVKYDSHEAAALAILQLSGLAVNGRPLKCGWGKDRSKGDDIPTFNVNPLLAMYGPNAP